MKKRAKKIIWIAHLLLIASWPSVFLVIIGYFDSDFRSIVARAFGSTPYFGLLLFFTASGLVFAAIGFHKKENYIRKDFLCAHITASFLVVLVCILDSLPLTGNSPVRQNILSFGIWSILPFVVGFTLFTTIRSIVIYKKRSLI